MRDAERAYARGDCETALRGWRAAYDATREPDLLRRMALCPQTPRGPQTQPMAGDAPLPEGDDLGTSGRAARRWAFAALVGGVASLGLGVGFAVAAESAEDEATRRAVAGEPGVADLVVTDRRDRRLAASFLVAAGALGVASLVVYLTWR